MEPKYKGSPKKGHTMSNGPGSEISLPKLATHEYLRIGGCPGFAGHGDTNAHIITSERKKALSATDTPKHKLNSHNSQKYWV